MTVWYNSSDQVCKIPLLVGKNDRKMINDVQDCDAIHEDGKKYLENYGYNAILSPLDQTLLPDWLDDKCDKLEYLRKCEATLYSYAKNPELNKVIWTIFSKIKLTELSNPRIFMSLRKTNFSHPDPRIMDNIEDSFELIGREGAALFDRDSDGVPRLREFKPEILKQLALDNLYEDRLKGFIEGIKLWNTGKGQPINDIVYFWFHSPDLNQVKNILGNDGFLIRQCVKCYCPDNYMVRSVIEDTPTHYSRILFDVPLYKEKETATALYVTYPYAYKLLKNDQDMPGDNR